MDDGAPLIGLVGFSELGTSKPGAWPPLALEADPSPFHPDDEPVSGLES